MGNEECDCVICRHGGKTLETISMGLMHVSNEFTRQHGAQATTLALFTVAIGLAAKNGCPRASLDDLYENLAKKLYSQAGEMADRGEKGFDRVEGHRMHVTGRGGDA